MNIPGSWEEAMDQDFNDSDEDPDFVPTETGTTDDEEDHIITDAEEQDHDHDHRGGGDEDEDEEEEDDDETSAGGGLQIAYDASTRQILLMDSSGRASILTAAALQGSSLTLPQLRQMLQARFGGRGTARDESEDEEEEEEEEDDGDWYSRGTGTGGRRRRPKNYYPVIKTPQEEGVRLERSGDFGPPPIKYSEKMVKERPKQLPSLFRMREFSYGKTRRSTYGDFTLPNSAGTEVSQFTSKVYSGQYSHDGSFFYTACQDFCIYIYDTSSSPSVGSKSITDSTPLNTSSGRPTRRNMFDYQSSRWDHRSSLKTKAIIRGNASNCRWTITDANLSKDGKWLTYSSITPRIHLTKLKEGDAWATEDYEQETLDLSEGIPRAGGVGIWSVRFSNDGREIVAGGNTGGTSHGQMFVYDLETRRTILRLNAHSEDINAVSFASEVDSNLLLSGSDDALIRVWDRRSLGSGRSSGVLVGHTEGVTYVEAKGDGRYGISNGKDQAVKLWDFRMMMSNEEIREKGVDRVEWGIPGWDYRDYSYRRPTHVKHPHDVSVMTYRGHAVLRTLIRCHWSPEATTDQRYIYSGSANGIVHIWSLDGRIAKRFDRRQTRSLLNPTTGHYQDPSDQDTFSHQEFSPVSAVRDVSWHPTKPEMISTAWGGSRDSEGTLSMHLWKERVRGENWEDGLERERLEAEG